MKKLLIFLLAIVMLSSCKLFQFKDKLEVNPVVVDIPDGEQFDTTALGLTPNGFTFVQISPTKVAIIPPASGPKKVKIKNSGNTTYTDKSKTKADNLVIGEGNNLDASVTKDKSKDKSKVKDVGNVDNRKAGQQKDVGNTTTKTGSTWWVYLIVAGVALFMFYPKIKRFIPWL